VAKYPFAGFPEYVERAATEIDRPEAARPAYRIATLSAVSNLCAQAADSDVAHVPGILEKAGEFRDQLHVAWRAAELMIAELSSRRGLEADRTSVPERSEPAPDPCPASKPKPRRRPATITTTVIPRP
jgi:hypothetical protein